MRLILQESTKASTWEESKHVLPDTSISVKQMELLWVPNTPIAQYNKRKMDFYVCTKIRWQFLSALEEPSFLAYFLREYVYPTT